VWLHRTLQIRYRDIVMPSLPSAKFSGRFEPAFIKERMTALEDFTNWSVRALPLSAINWGVTRPSLTLCCRVAQHPVTRTDPIVTVFLEQPEGEWDTCSFAAHKTKPSSFPSLSPLTKPFKRATSD